MPTLVFYKATASIAARKYTLRYKGGALSLDFEALQSWRPKEIWLFLKFNWSIGRSCFLSLHSSILTNLLTSYLSADFLWLSLIRNSPSALWYMPADCPLLAAYWYSLKIVGLTTVSLRSYSLRRDVTNWAWLQRSHVFFAALLHRFPDLLSLDSSSPDSFLCFKYLHKSQTPSLWPLKTSTSN